MTKRENLTFKGSNPRSMNACAGNNGEPSYIDYAEGFSKVANLMLDEIITNDNIKLVDIIIYPICFNMRHSVELRLKGAIVELQKLSTIKGNELNFNLSGSHDIGNIWAFIKEKSINFDKRYKFFIDKLDDYILDIADIDATGQTFRYPHDKESKDRHLIDFPVINLLILKERFSELELILDKLNHFNIFLSEEYSLETFTTKLSRAELFELADKLPPRNKWAEENFVNTKKEMMGYFKISSNDFCRAIKKIEANYELASLISKPLALKGISSEELEIFFNYWFQLYQTKPKTQSITIWKELSGDFHEIWNHGVNYYNVLNRLNERNISLAIKRNISLETIIGLQVLFEFSRDRQMFSEYYEIYYKSFENCKTSKEKQVERLLEKTTTAENILKSLYFLGHSEIAEKIIKKHNLYNWFSWLEEARNGTLFLKPEIYGYKVS